jgi:thiol-disulfide isomerase/thioredoxin
MNRILIGLLLMIACHEIPEDRPEADVSISGVIRNVGTGPVEVFDAFGYLVATSELEDGRFRSDLNVPSGAYYVMKIEKTSTPLYLSPGYQLILSMDAANPAATLTFEGRGQESNRYIRAYEAFEQENKPSYELLLVKSEEEFLVEARRYRSKCEAFLRNYQAHHFNLDPNFIDKEKARILYSWSNQLIRYPEAHLYFTGEDEFVVSDTYHDYMKTVNLNAVDLISLPEYQAFLQAYITSEADVLLKKGDKRNPDQIKFDLVLQNISEQEVKDFALHQVTIQALRFGINEISEDLSKKFLEISSNGMMRAEVRTVLQRWQGLEPGNKAPRFFAWDHNGKKITPDGFRGSYVYLHFWASWCASWMDDFEKLKELCSLIGNDQIVFISLSLDENPDLWSEIVAQRPSDEIIQGRVASDEISAVWDLYMIHSLPRNVLLDPGGHIINAAAPGPSDPALLQLLEMHALALP